jgi:hypothetical protein
MFCNSQKVWKVENFYFIFSKNNLKLIELFGNSGEITPEELSLTAESAEKLWYRIFITTMFAKYGQKSCVFLSLIVYEEFFRLYWPQEFLYPFGIICYVTTILWSHYVVIHFNGYIFIFNQICYYLMIRFEECNKSLKRLLKDRNISSLSKILVEHNSIYELVVEYNSFWKFVLLIDALLFSLILCFITYLAFFSPLVFWFKFIFSIFTLFVMFCFLIIFFSAAFVSSKVRTNNLFSNFELNFKKKFKAHESYLLLNKLNVEVKDKPLLLQIQLDQYIQRLGGPTIGFYCWNFKPITKLSTFKVSLNKLLFRYQMILFLIWGNLYDLESFLVISRFGL